MPGPLEQLYSEHHSLIAVLGAMSALVREVRERGRRVDPKAFRAMLYYLDVFLEREHHHKEELVFSRGFAGARPRPTPSSTTSRANINRVSTRFATWSKRSCGMRSVVTRNSSRLPMRSPLRKALLRAHPQRRARSDAASQTCAQRARLGRHRRSLRAASRSAGWSATARHLRSTVQPYRADSACAVRGRRAAGRLSQSHPFMVKPDL